ncbi:MAG TPA: hypothetical protein VF992_10905 [Thermoplasmata archaeon]
MDDRPFPRTDFVRRTLEQRRYEPEVSYARDLLALERLLSSRAVGMADSIALSNLVSRYPREADAIVSELGVRSFVPFEDDRLAALVDERLQLALRRHPLPRLRAETPLHPFEF